MLAENPSGALQARATSTEKCVCHIKKGTGSSGCWMTGDKLDTKLNASKSVWAYPSGSESVINYKYR